MTLQKRIANLETDLQTQVDEGWDRLLRQVDMPDLEALAYCADDSPKFLTALCLLWDLADEAGRKLLFDRNPRLILNEMEANDD